MWMLMGRFLGQRLQNRAPPPPPSAKTTGTPMQYVQTAKTPTKALSALKTVLQDTESQEYLITRANNVH